MIYVPTVILDITPIVLPHEAVYNPSSCLLLRDTETHGCDHVIKQSRHQVNFVAISSTVFLRPCQLCCCLGRHPDRVTPPSQSGKSYHLAIGMMIMDAIANTPTPTSQSRM